MAVSTSVVNYIRPVSGQSQNILTTQTTQGMHAICEMLFNDIFWTWR